jgi:hypothetical protein
MMTYTTEQLTFLTAATDVVAKFTPVEAVLYAGTLFVKCDRLTAAKIKTALREVLGCGVIHSQVGPEAAFDFC